MTHAIVINRIKSSKDANSVALLLSREQGISLNDAQEKLKILPCVYMNGIEESELNEHTEPLRSLDVEFKITTGTEKAPKHNPPSSVGTISFNHGKSPSFSTTAKKTITFTQEKKKTSPLVGWGIFITILALIVTAVLYVPSKTNTTSSKSKKNTVKPSKKTTSTKRSTQHKSSSSQKKVSPQEARVPVSNKKRSEITPKEKVQSSAYVDSVNTTDDHLLMIRFYKIAISFNKYNKKAWNGLVATYYKHGMNREARIAEKQMEEIFGIENKSIPQIISRYGKLLDFELSSNAHCRISYESEKRNQSEVEREMFHIVMEVAAERVASKLSLESQNAQKKRRTVDINLRNLPRSFQAFQKLIH